MKISIIIPVYNVEEYILKCLKSINNQSYQNFEAIIVNDGSPDSSKDIITKFIKNKPNFKYYEKENGGLSDARNYGLKYATGDYILFVDSDDSINKDLLLELNNTLSNNQVDIVNFNLNIIKDNDIRTMPKQEFTNLSPNQVIEILLKNEFFEPAWLYCYNRKFWNKHKFKYTKGRFHEDFGLTPLILINAKTITSISYIGYNYLIRSNSIMTNNNYEKTYKKYQDCLSYFKENIPLIEKCNNIDNHTKALLLSFYTNGIIERLKYLQKEDFENELLKLKKDKVFDYLLDDNIKRKIKKILYKYFTKWSIKRK